MQGIEGNSFPIRCIIIKLTLTLTSTTTVHKYTDLPSSWWSLLWLFQKSSFKKCWICYIVRESTGRCVKVARLQCKYHPDCELIEDFHAGDLICPECGLVVGDRLLTYYARIISSTALFCSVNSSSNMSKYLKMLKMSIYLHNHFFRKWLRCEQFIIICVGKVWPWFP